MSRCRNARSSCCASTGPTHRNPLLLFPAEGRNHIELAQATEPMSKSSVQDAFRAALKASGNNKRASVHTLRHSWATHLLGSRRQPAADSGVAGPQFAGHHQRLHAPDRESRTTRRRGHQPAHERPLAPHAGCPRGNPASEPALLMLEVADIFRLHGPAYRAQFGDRMLPSHRRAMQDIETCRTESLGGQLYYCAQCDEQRYSYHSCKNRHCPKCQNEQANQWLAEQQQLLLPVPYFMVTFTLPAELRRAGPQ